MAGLDGHQPTMELRTVGRPYRARLIRLGFPPTHRRSIQSKPLPREDRRQRGKEFEAVAAAAVGERGPPMAGLLVGDASGSEEACGAEDADWEGLLLTASRTLRASTKARGRPALAEGLSAAAVGYSQGRVAQTAL